MKFLLTFLTMTIAWLAADSVTFVDHDKVAAALAKGAPLMSASDLSVRRSHRDAGAFDNGLGAVRRPVHLNPGDGQSIR